MTRRIIVALLVLVASPVSADDFSRVFDSPHANEDRRIEKAVTLQGFHDWKPPATLEEWRKERERRRRQILVAAGLWPMPEKTPLRPMIHGKVERDAYTVERVYFESYPDFFVTGSLYRPKSKPGTRLKRPAVLCPHGHWSNGRFYRNKDGAALRQIDAGKEQTIEGARFPLQARCAQLARLGCVVFHFDMIGYADSMQIPHRAGFGDLEAELQGQSWFGIQTWNTIRAYDFLESLDDVDPSRIGVTGASGGGTQTFILGAVDDRPAALFPAVMVSVDMQGGCVCENASHLRVGATNITFAALAAPRPYGMTGANDWTIDILEKGLPELKSVWRLHGKEADVQAWCYPEFEHNYNQVSREHMYAWFNRHLKLGHDEPIREKPFKPLLTRELRVFDAEHQLPASAVDVTKLREYLTSTSRRQIAALGPKDAASLAEFRRVIGGGLETVLHTSLPDRSEVELRRVGRIEKLDGIKIIRLVIGRKGSGEQVPTVFLEPQDWDGTIVVVLSERGKRVLFSRDGDALGEESKQLLRRRAAILAPDLFLTGEHLADGEPPAGPASERFKKDSGRHANFVGYTYGYNRTLIAQRVHDALTAIAFAVSSPGTKKVNLLGLGRTGLWTILARALSGDVVSRTSTSLDEGLFLEKVDSLDHPQFLPGALRLGGTSAFLALCAPGSLRLHGGPAPQEVALAAYRAAGSPDALVHRQRLDREEAAAELDWIAR